MHTFLLIASSLREKWTAEAVVDSEWEPGGVMFFVSLEKFLKGEWKTPNMLVLIFFPFGFYFWTLSFLCL